MDYITLALAKDYADKVAAGGGGGSKTYTYEPCINRLPTIEVTNEEYGFTQERNTFLVENSGIDSQYCTTYINIIEEDITNIILDISILPGNADDSFLETNCTLSVCVNPSSDNVLVFTSSTVIEKNLIIPIYKGDQLKLDWN